MIVQSPHEWSVHTDDGQGTQLKAKTSQSGAGGHQKCQDTPSDSLLYLADGWDTQPSDLGTITDGPKHPKCWLGHPTHCWLMKPDDQDTQLTTWVLKRWPGHTVNDQDTPNDG